MKILVIIIICLFTSCSQETETVVVHGYVHKDSPVHFMRRHYKLKVWYDYVHDGIKYQGIKTISKNENRYFEGDSVYVKLNKADPYQSEIIGKIEKPKKVAKYVSKVKKGNGIKAYSIVDKKPVFNYNGLSGEMALEQYFSFQIKDIGIQEKGVVGVNFTINEEGNIESAKVSRNLNAFLDTVAIEMVKDMPQWLPAEHNGEKVKVSYLAEIKFNVNK